MDIGSYGQSNWSVVGQKIYTNIRFVKYIKIHSFRMKNLSVYFSLFFRPFNRVTLTIRSNGIQGEYT
jgi:hypothetical protein